MSRLVEFDQEHSILNKLENACLLEWVTKDYNTRCVKKHDLIRDMALKIMSCRCMVEASAQLRDLPDKEKWKEGLEKVSLMNNNILEIRSGVSPRCQRLSTLLLLGNGGLRRIPDSFFVLMCMLRVLDLSRTGIEVLPKSIVDSENLVALLLRWCSKLKCLPSLAKLCALRKLDLNGSGIEEVPEGMEMLINLKYLNLKEEYLKSLPCGILPRLRHLQCLIVW
ncbi:hypothetical protein L1049_016750 [Liquidambar formosana]|uniref:Uncharacterized protein n=1 Tax=Liquidambar formosana TaxID=63359 RepID=A0AAP0S1N4_LIQFO